MLAGGLFYFDDWMWGAKQDRGAKIGVIVSQKGDVRLKFDGDLKWQKAQKGQDLVYNDAIYSGSGSQADLSLGNSKLVVDENTLIVLRRDNQVNFLNLNYGSLLGRVAKNDKILIDVGTGSPIELSSKGGAEVLLKKVGNRTQVDVKSGQADVIVDGKKKTITPEEKLVVGEAVKYQKQRGIKITQPQQDQVFYSENPVRIPFAWTWDDGRAATPEEKYTLEFSGQSDFERISSRKAVDGALSTDMNASQSLSLFVRVRGPNGELSPPGKVNFVRMQKSVIVSPVAGQRYMAPPGTIASVPIEFNRPENTTVWYQIARDPEFNEVIANYNTSTLKFISELAVGSYFLRARTDYGNNNLTSWSEVHPFFVDMKLDEIRMAQRTPSRVIIPNANYPSDMYSSSPEKVRTFLAERGMMADFFGSEAGQFDSLRLKFDSGDQAEYRLRDTRWPAPKLEPGRYSYRYQLSKAGYRTSPWSQARQLDIVMEPPRPVGEPRFSEKLDKKNRRRVDWEFTPLLFARSYDVEVANDPTFVNAHKFKTNKPAMSMKLPNRDLFWRARARDAQGRLISGFSKAQPLPKSETIPSMLAQNDRTPQSVQKSRTKAQGNRDNEFLENGWYGWVGTGYNYVDYRQSNQLGTITSNSGKMPSQYIETGYTSLKGWGGIFSYKNTPGQITTQLPAGVSLDRREYNWTTMSFEGVMRRMSRFRLFRRPVIYGVRMGVQQHITPFLYLQDDTTLQFKYNQMMTGSLGLLAELPSDKWTYFWLMRYQFPFSSQATGGDQMSISPTFAFDGSIGMAYNFTRQWKLGLFWYGQWHQYNFNYLSSTNSNSGFQSLFYSNMDMRLGFDF